MVLQTGQWVFGGLIYGKRTFSGDGKARLFDCLGGHREPLGNDACRLLCSALPYQGSDCTACVAEFRNAERIGGPGHPSNSQGAVSQD